MEQGLRRNAAPPPGARHAAVEEGARAGREGGEAVTVLWLCVDVFAVAITAVVVAGCVNVIVGLVRELLE